MRCLMNDSANDVCALSGGVGTDFSLMLYFSIPTGACLAPIIIF